MRLLLKIQYYNILFGEGADVAALIAAFDKVHIVESKGYGETAKYTVQSEICPELTLIPDDSLTLPENQSEFLDSYHKVAEERDKLKSEVYELKNKIKEIEKAVGDEGVK